ncbi:MAG: tetratricopeptide repeat protein, partial [Leptospiraceae bacterium]|nr:tetratricopeptide repeat protein [Leptospiraceae bacterium]
QEPNSPVLLYNLARLYYEQEQYEKSHTFSLKSYKNSNEVLTKKKEALFLIGMSLFRLQKFPESISIWNQYLIDYPEEEGIVLYYRGISYLENGEREKSKQDLKQCIQVTKNESIKASAVNIYNSNFHDDESNP